MKSQYGVILTLYFSYIRNWKWIEMISKEVFLTSEMLEINVHDTYKWKKNAKRTPEPWKDQRQMAVESCI